MTKGTKNLSKNNRNLGLQRENEKLHYRMYKSGRNWLFAGIATVALAGGMAMTQTKANADTTTEPTTEQVTPAAGTTDTTTDTTPAATTTETPTTTADQSTDTTTVATSAAPQATNKVTDNLGGTATVSGDNTTAHQDFTADTKNSTATPISSTGQNAGQTTLTDGGNDQRGYMRLNDKLDFSKDFEINGQVQIGNSKDDGDGVTFVLSPTDPSSVDESSDSYTSTGGYLGLAGLKDAVGLAIDTHYNSDKSYGDFNAADANPLIEFNDALISWRTTDSNGKVVSNKQKAGGGIYDNTTSEDPTSQVVSLNTKLLDGKYHDFTIAYTASTSLLTITIPENQAGDNHIYKNTGAVNATTWSRTITASQKASGMYLGFMATTGDDTATQGIKINKYIVNLQTTTVNFSGIDANNTTLPQATSTATANVGTVITVYPNQAAAQAAIQNETNAKAQALLDGTDYVPAIDVLGVTYAANVPGYHLADTQTFTVHSDTNQFVLNYVADDANTVPSVSVEGATGDETDGYNVNGTGTVGATITLVVDGGATKTATVGKDGTWTINLTPGEGNIGDTITVTPTVNGKTGDPVTSTLTDKNAGGDNGGNTNPGDTDNPGGGDNGGNNNGETTGSVKYRVTIIDENGHQLAYSGDTALTGAPGSPVTFGEASYTHDGITWAKPGTVISVPDIGGDITIVYINNDKDTTGGTDTTDMDALIQSIKDLADKFGQGNGDNSGNATDLQTILDKLVDQLKDQGGIDAGTQSIIDKLTSLLDKVGNGEDTTATDPNLQGLVDQLTEALKNLSNGNADDNDLDGLTDLLNQLIDKITSNGGTVDPALQTEIDKLKEQIQNNKDLQSIIDQLLKDKDNVDPSTGATDGKTAQGLLDLLQQLIDKGQVPSSSDLEKLIDTLKETLNNNNPDIQSILDALKDLSDKFGNGTNTTDDNSKLTDLLTQLLGKLPTDADGNVDPAFSDYADLINKLIDELKGSTDGTLPSDFSDTLKQLIDKLGSTNASDTQSLIDQIIKELQGKVTDPSDISDTLKDLLSKLGTDNNAAIQDLLNQLLDKLGNGTGNGDNTTDNSGKTTVVVIPDRDGKDQTVKVTTNPDGSTTLTFPDGSTLTIPAGKTTPTELPNGGTVIINPDGTITFTNPDGSTITIDPSNGAGGTTNPSGTQDGSKVTVLVIPGKDGKNPETIAVEKTKDGDVILHFPDGSTKTVEPGDTGTTPAGNTYVVNPDGSITFTTPDGGTFTIYPDNGNVTTSNGGSGDGNNNGDNGDGTDNGNGSNTGDNGSETGTDGTNGGNGSTTGTNGGSNGSNTGTGANGSGTGNATTANMNGQGASATGNGANNGSTKANSTNSGSSKAANKASAQTLPQTGEAQDNMSGLGLLGLTMVMFGLAGYKKRRTNQITSY